MLSRVDISLRDILHHIDLIDAFMTGSGRDTFVADQKTVYAVTHVCSRS